MLNCLYFKKINILLLCEALNMLINHEPDHLGIKRKHHKGFKGWLNQAKANHVNIDGRLRYFENMFLVKK